jgi:hypothetical protein
MGADYFFCSIGCQHAFDARPEQFVAASANASDRPPAGESRHQDNPPFTESGGVVSPMFGSAASGGLEYEPGPERPEHK